MYKIFIDNLQHLQVMLGVNNTEYVDVFLTEERALFITNSTELMALVMFPCNRSVAEQDANFRIQRGMLKNLVSSGGMNVSIDNNVVRIDFFSDSGARFCSAKFERLQVFNSAYTDKIKLVESVRTTNYINTDEFQGLARVCRSSGSVLTVDEGLAVVSVSQNIKVCKRVNTTTTFTVSQSSLDALRKCNKNIFSIKNYLCAFQDGLAIVAIKSRYYTDDTIKYLLQDTGGAKYKAIIDFGTLTSFLSVEKLRPSSITISVNSQICELDENDVKYSIPVLIKDAKCVENAQFSGFALPYRVISSVFLPLNRTIFSFAKRKHFIELTDKDYTIYFN